MTFRFVLTFLILFNFLFHIQSVIIKVYKKILCTLEKKSEFSSSSFFFLVNQINKKKKKIKKYLCECR